MGHTPDIDLNLLVVLDALLQERSVTRAAERLGTTQSTLSTALGRLRKVLGDPILVRAPGGMTPTPRALALEGPLRESLAGLNRILQAPQTFDPLHTTRTFTIAATDYTQFVVIGPLLRRLQQEAPRLRLEVAPLEGHFPWEKLAEGEVDLVLAGATRAPEGLQSRALFRDEAVCVVRKDHPALTAPFSLASYLALSHVEVHSVGGITLAEQALARLDKQRHLSLIVPQFMVAPFLVLQTELCFTLARRLAEPLAAWMPLEMLPLPFETPPIAVRAYWHRRAQDDPAHRWLRAQISLAAGETNQG